MAQASEPDRAGIIQALKTLGQGQGDLPQAVQMLIDEGGTNRILEASQNSDPEVRDGLAMCFLYHRNLSSDDKGVHKKTVIGDQYYFLIDVYAKDFPEENEGIVVIAVIVNYALTSGRVDEAMLLQRIYREYPGFYDGERATFNRLREAATASKKATSTA